MKQKALSKELQHFIEVCHINTKTRKKGSGFMFDPHDSFWLGVCYNGSSNN